MPIAALIGPILYKKIEKLLLFSLRKKKKYDTLLSGNCFCSSVSSRRQPVESFFHWIHCKSGILDTSHARSLSGILFHIFSALAFIALLSQFYY